MKQDELGLLLRLISNYVNHCENLQEAKSFLREVAEYPSRPKLTNEERVEMYWNTVHALNASNEEANRYAFEIRLKAFCSGNEELIKKIEYLHEVI